MEAMIQHMKFWYLGHTTQQTVRDTCDEKRYCVEFIAMSNRIPTHTPEVLEKEEYCIPIVKYPPVKIVKMDQEPG